MNEAQQIAFVICKYFNYSLLIIRKSTINFVIIFVLSKEDKHHQHLVVEKYSHQQYQKLNSHNQYQLQIIKQVFWKRSWRHVRGNNKSSRDNSTTDTINTTWKVSHFIFINFFLIKIYFIILFLHLWHFWHMNVEMLEINVIVQNFVLFFNFSIWSIDAI